jgi:hypothetical protein
VGVELERHHVTRCTFVFFTCRAPGVVGCRGIDSGIEVSVSLVFKKGSHARRTRREQQARDKHAQDIAAQLLPLISGCVRACAEVHAVREQAAVAVRHIVQRARDGMGNVQTLSPVLPNDPVHPVPALQRVSPGCAPVTAIIIIIIIIIMIIIIIPPSGAIIIIIILTLSPLVATCSAPTCTPGSPPRRHRSSCTLIRSDIIIIIISQSHTLRPSASGTEYRVHAMVHRCGWVAGRRAAAWLLLLAACLLAAGPCWRLLRQPSLFSICCCTRDSTDGRWARTPVVGTTTVVVLGRRSQGCAAARRRRWLLLTGWPRCTAGTRGRCQGRGLGSLRGSNCHVVPEWP